MWKIIVIFVCKFINKLSKLLGHEGSVIGGHYALKLDKNILKKIELPKYVVGITGSSGKSSSTELMYNILTKNNYTVCYNKEGSNTINGITSMILNNCNFFGKVKKDILLMELDEQFMKYIFEHITPTHLMITNITRDQPPRNSHPEKIYNAIKGAIPEGTTLILNVDDPFVNRLRINHKGIKVSYGVSQNDYSIASKLHNLDACYCPICNSKLEYEFYHYGHIGSYQCPKYHFYRGTPQYEAKNVDVVNRRITINEKEVKLPSNFLYTVYFVTGCYALCKSLGLSDDEILNVLNGDIKTKRLNIYKFNKRNWQMLASKNENNLSYKQSLDYIVHEDGDKTIILGFDSSSRRYKENDISWIWDIDFEILKHDSIKNIILIGKFCYDLELRMKYANIEDDKIILVPDLKDLAKIIKKKTKGNIYSMVCFDKEIQLKNIIKEEQK
ncbi:MAG: DUF1727 domain-containing protein [Bacilli bacterium]|nr:DUF1727 domain-containing protein [Bacilli bacterium]